MAAADLSVVIPTHNRADSLEEALLGLRSADGAEGVEVIVVDDCSADRTAAVLSGMDWVRTVTLPESLGSSAARNAGVRVASGRHLLFLDDDIVAKEDLITRHLAFHERHPGVEQALVGIVTWDPRQHISRHMLWLEDGGPLFAFNEIEDHDDVGPEHFCTANVSVKRELLSRVDGPFDPGLRRFTDVDLGLRLKSEGMKLHHDPHAVGWHLRRDTPASTDRRMFVVGAAAHAMEQRHHAVWSAPTAPRPTALGWLKAAVARLLTPVAPILGTRTAGRIWGCRAAWAYGRGWRSAA